MWEGSQGTTKLLMFTVPDYSGLVIFIFMSSFFLLSFFLATASMVTPLQGWGLNAVSWAKPAMLPILSVSFVLSWMSSTLELPDDQWWTPVLVVGGFVMFLFIGFRDTLTSFLRFLRQKLRPIAGRKPAADAKPDGPGDGEPNRPPEQTALLERMRSLSGHLRLTKSGGLWGGLSEAVHNLLKSIGSSMAKMWGHGGRPHR